MKKLLAIVVLGLLPVTAVLIVSLAPQGSAFAGADESQALWKKKCAMCHGADGKGNAKMAEKFKLDPAMLDMTKEGTQAKSDEELHTLTAEGKGRMPGYAKKMSSEEIDALIAHIRELAGG